MNLKKYSLECTVSAGWCGLLCGFYDDWNKLMHVDVSEQVFAIGYLGVALSTERF